MANQDPRLQWRQLTQAQPNVSGLMAQVRGGINDAAGAAEGILGRYQEGQELKAENELIRRIGGMDQEQLRTAFSSGAFDDLNLGANGVDILNGAMGQRADVRSTNVSTDKTQASIGWGNDANSRANAGEARNATRFGWEGDDRTDALARRDWRRDNAGNYVDAEGAAFQNGLTAFSSHIERNESGGGSDQYDTLYGHRNRQNGVRVSNMTIGQASEFAAPNGEYGQSVNSEIGRVATPMGKFQIVGTTLRGIQSDLGLPDDVPFSPAVQEQMGLYLAQQRVNGTRTREAMREGLRNEWEGFGNLSNGELDQIIDEVRSQPPVTRDSILQAASTGQQPSAGPARQGGFQPTAIDRGGSQYARDMAASGLFTGSEVLDGIQPIRQAATAGQEVIDDQRSQYQADVLAGVMEQVAQSPDALNAAEAETMIRELLLETGDFSQAEAVSGAQRGVAAIGESEGFSADLTGGAVPAVVAGAIEESAANTIADSQRRLDSTDQARQLRDLPRYEEDPYTNLETDLGLPSDPEQRGDYDSNKFRNFVNARAREFEVTPAVMAVALRDAFERDPGDDGEWWELDFDMTRNTFENRFNVDRIEQTVAGLSNDARRDWDRQSSNQTIRSNQLEQNAQQQVQIQRRLQKAQEQGDSATVEQMLNRLEALRQQAANISTQEILQSSR